VAEHHTVADGSGLNDQDSIMPINVKCPSCGKTLAAPDAAAGKRAKCPGCAQIITIPAAVQQAEIIGAAAPVAAAVQDPYGTSDPAPATSRALPAARGEQRRPCPDCGEMIIVGAAKCRFCGAIFDPRLKSELAASGSSTDGLSTNQYILYTLLFLFIPCACVLIGSGLYYYWRAKRPKMAKQINTLGWIVVGVQLLLSGILQVIGR
jgi:predicted RNA-binding Zn-ribbon protein involved in translation (DUF1610 family)